jgi:hypothetical protein
MASQRPARDIVRRDYHAIINYKNDKPVHPPAHPLAHPPAHPPADPPANPPANPPAHPPAHPPIDPLLIVGLDDAFTAEPIPTTVATNSNIYDDLDDDLRITLATSIQPLESVS